MKNSVSHSIHCFIQTSLFHLFYQMKIFMSQRCIYVIFFIRFEILMLVLMIQGKILEKYKDLG